MLKEKLILLAMILSCSISAQEETEALKNIHDANYGLLIAQQTSNDLYGVMDSAGNIVVPFQYDYIYPFFDELALVYHEDQCGYFNLKGDLAIPMEYTTGSPFRQGKAVVSKNFVSGVIDKTNQVIIPFKYEALQTRDHNIYHFQLKPRASGLMDRHEQVLVEPIYDVLLSRNDSLWIARRNKKFIILKNNGDLHCPEEFDQIGKKNSANLLRFSIDRKIGFLNEHFQIAIPAQYERSSLALGQMVSVYNGTKWGFVDRNNQPITGFIYDQIKALNKEYVIVVKDGKSNIIDQNAQLQLEQGGDYIKGIENSDLVFIDGHIYDRDFNKKTEEQVRLADGPINGMLNGRIQIYVRNQVGYLDSLGNMKIPPTYDNGNHFHKNGYTAVSKEGKWGFIDKDAKLIIPIDYDSVFHFGSFDYCNYLTLKDDRYGYFLGEQAILAPQFEELIIGEGESIIYRKKDQYGIINKENNEVSPFLYDHIHATGYGYEIEKEGQFGFLDLSLNMVIPPTYKYLKYAGFYLIAQQNGKYGTLSENNEVIQDFIYDKIEDKPLGLTKIYKAGKVGILSTAGKELLPPIYDQIKKVNWKNVEVFIDGQSEIINIGKLEMERIAEKKR